MIHITGDFLLPTEVGSLAYIPRLKTGGFTLRHRNKQNLRWETISYSIINGYIKVLFINSAKDSDHLWVIFYFMKIL
jgi:hypothetical protein